MEKYILLEDKERVGPPYQVLCWCEKKRFYISIALFYWKEVADAYLEMCDACGHLNIKG